jgi:hypothetical protein
VRVVDEFDAGFGWQRNEPELLARTGHAVRARSGVWLTDPPDAEGLDERVRELGEPAGVVQLLDRHERDCSGVAARLGVPHHRVPFDGVPGAEPIKVADRIGWHEVALWFPAERTLVCGDAVGSAAYFLAPGERLAVHPLLRLWPPRALGRVEPDHVLCGHGEGVHGERAAEALQEALRTARRRIPKWLPASIRAGRTQKR